MVAVGILALLIQDAQVPTVTWVKLSEEKPGRWKASAKYPVLGGDAPLTVKANQILREQCEARFRTFAAGRQDTIVLPSTPREFRLDSFVSVAGPTLVSFQVRVNETGAGEADVTELSPVTVGIVRREPKALQIPDVFKKDADLAKFTADLVLQPANETRKAHGLEPLSEFSPDLLGPFAVTKTNLAFAVGPGVLGPDADQVRVPLSALGVWADPAGPLGSGAVEQKTTVRVTGYATWIHRETLPLGAEMVVSLLRDRDDALETGFGSTKFFVLTPPANFESTFEVSGIREDDRMYLDVRIVADGKTLFRNRATTRVPLQGWASKREVKLVRESGQA
ncbi:MAG: YbaY family lipoprotein [Armatimonadetes bacterium]|nr:YbaY family lipoprotein [Armatimonadota bacterium]